MTCRVEPLERRAMLAADVQVISIFGTDVNDGDTTPAELEGTDFGTALVSETRPFRTFQILNTSDADNLELGGLTVPAGFQVEQGLPDVLGPGASSFFTISMLADVQATRSGTVQFTTNVPGKETFDFAVTGTLAARTPPADNVHENVASFTDSDAMSRAQGSDLESLPIEMVNNQLLRFNVQPAQGVVTFSLDTSEQFVGATGDGQLVVVRDADGDGALDLDELNEPAASFADSPGNGATQQTVPLANGTYFALLRVANFATIDPPAFPPTVTLDYTLDATIAAAPTSGVSVSFGNVVIADGDTVPSATNGTDFGSATVGAAAPQRTFTVSNTGNTPITLGQVSATGAFAIVSNLPATLDPGALASFVVQMPTTTAGQKSGTVSFATSVGDKNPYDFAIAGTVTPSAAPEVAVSLQGGGSLSDAQASAVEFGSVVENQTGPTRTFVVTNSGTATLTLGAVAVPAGFVLSEPLVTALAAGASDTFTVTLDSGAPGDKSGTLAIPSNDADENPFDVPLHGVVVLAGATPEAEITVLIDGAPASPGQSIDFGSTPLGGAGPQREITLRNDGTAALVLAAPTLPAGFTLVAPLPDSLAPGDSVTLRIALSSATAGTFAGIATINSGDTDEGAFALNLNGTVTPAVAESALAVGNVIARVPAVVIAGTRSARGVVSAPVTNTSSTLAFRDSVTFTVVASSDELSGPADTTLASVTRNLRLKPGATRTIKLKVKFPEATPEGQKNLLVSLSGASVSALGVAGAQVGVQKPFVAITGLVGSAASARPLTFGRRATFQLPLQNAGNVPTSRSPATYSLLISRDGTEAGQVFQTTTTARINLKPGVSRPQRLSITFPPGAFAAGSYVLIVKLISADLNQTNGQNVAAIPFAIA